MTLALLLTAATGAWAQSTFQVKELTADMVSGWSATDNTPFELSDLPGFVEFISSDEAKAWADVPSTGRVSLIYKFEDGKLSCVDFVNGQLDDPATSTLTAHKAAYNRIHGAAGPDWTFKRYYTTATPFPINWNATAKTASIAAMPAGNVTVKVNYYPQATADGAVTAATGAIATTDAPLVTIDTDMLTGADGMMYYVSESNTAPDYTATGWTTDVPNAKNYTETKTLYLWYYPLGHVGQTADDIYSDGNMNAEPLVLSVAPVPTYNVYFAESADPDHWTAVPDKNVKPGQKVTVTYTGTGIGPRRVMGVIIEKKPTITIGDKVYRIQPGETWEHLNERLELGWTIWERDDDIYCVVYNNQIISVSSDGNNWQTLEFRIDSPIDTNMQYKWQSVGN